MMIKLQDHTTASVNQLNGRSWITFHRLGKRLVLPVGITPTIKLLDKLYAALRV